ncbi:unnamed protein product [Urochloa humidicola]
MLYSLSIELFWLNASYPKKQSNPIFWHISVRLRNYATIQRTYVGNENIAQKQITISQRCRSRGLTQEG